MPLLRNRLLRSKSYDQFDIRRGYILLCTALLGDNRNIVGKRALAKPGLQLGEQHPPGIELSGVPCKFYCTGKHQRYKMPPLQLNMFLS